MKRNIILLFSILTNLNLYAQVDIGSKLDTIFSKHMLPASPGFSLGIVKNGELIHTYKHGLASLEHNVLITDQTIFRVASIAKQFTAACIGLLVSDKKMELSDDVRKYIPELPDYGKTITIRHLLNHTSGIRNHNALEQLKGFNAGYEGYTNQQVNELIFKQKGINHIPGEKILYSNSNYVLLALVVERVSGKNLKEFAAQRIFNPLGMVNTSFKSSNAEINQNHASAYYQNEKGYQLATSLNLCIGAGGLRSTVEDLAKWSAVFTNKAPLYSAFGTFLTTTDMLNDGQPSAYGRGVFVTGYKGYTAVHHSGMDLGVRVQMITLPKENISVILLANLENINAINLSYQILDLFLKPEPPVEKKTQRYTHNSKEIRQLTGDYQEQNSDLTIHIFLENDTLKARNSAARLAIPLVQRDKYVFERVNNASVSHTFNIQKDKKWDMAVDFSGAVFYFERVKLVDPSSVLVTDYIGQYYSDELEVTYSLFVEANQLFASFPYNKRIKLSPGQKDEFGSGNRTRYIFKRDHKNKITGFAIASEGTVKDILFKKILSNKQDTPKK